MELKTLEAKPDLLPWQRNLLTDSHALLTLKNFVSGPFHVVHPETFASNLHSFLSVFDELGIKGEVLFARKANKAHCWLPEVAKANQGCDVASAQELVGAFAGGISPARMAVTGAEKSEKLLWLAIRHGCRIAVDSLAELQRIERLAAEMDAQARVVVRILPDFQPESRFGLPAQVWLTSPLVANNSAHIRCEGVCFHLDGYSADQRIGATAHSIEIIDELRKLGHSASTIDIGGGFAISYLDRQRWSEFCSTITPSDYHAGRMPSGSYPYGTSEKTGPAMLREILTPLKGEIHSRAITIAIEPGRALLSGAGDTVFPVQGIKKYCGGFWESKNLADAAESSSTADNPESSEESTLASEESGVARSDQSAAGIPGEDDYDVVVVSGLSMSLSEQWKGREFSPDPTLWPASTPEDKPRRAAIGGASCMEYDMLTWRKVHFPRPVRHGDFLIYHNTAGYQMDKNESEFHQLPLPPKIVAHSNPGEGSQWNFSIDRPEGERS